MNSLSSTQYQTSIKRFNSVTSTAAKKASFNVLSQIQENECSNSEDQLTDKNIVKEHETLQVLLFIQFNVYILKCNIM